MASNKTPNLSLDIWAEMDYFKRAELNANFGKLDEVLTDVSSNKIGDLSEKKITMNVDSLGKI
ncbi:hypothetical protein CN978_30005 [Priestia megaterium]|uniref:hypothetical protein n=1 Tax=Priestia megaterium TaxID=1404 RepID=UPI000BFC8557|nr:hypothetical protein [Priestia megaterium]PGN53938.1 hypothetical protein CN978_30005 [Priestia megaterium]